MTSDFLMLLVAPVITFPNGTRCPLRALDAVLIFPVGIFFRVLHALNKRHTANDATACRTTPVAGRGEVFSEDAQ